VGATFALTLYLYVLLAHWILLLLAVEPGASEPDAGKGAHAVRAGGA
jgi:hypothetical protein